MEIYKMGCFFDYEIWYRCHTWKRRKSCGQPPGADRCKCGLL